MKSSDKAGQPPDVAAVNKNFVPFLLTVIFLFFFSTENQAQKLIINAVDGKVNANDTAILNRLVKYEAYLYNGLFEEHIPDSLPVVVNLYKSRKRFIEERNAQKVYLTRAGFYSSRKQECFVYCSDDYMNVILHEVSHRFMHYHNYYSVPHWINEGLAEFFGELYMNEKQAIYINQQTGRLKRIKEYINIDQFNVGSFFSVTANNLWASKKNITQRYDIAYGIVYYIIKTNPQYIRQILSALQQGKDSYEALAQCYGTYELFEKRFKIFYR